MVVFDDDVSTIIADFGKMCEMYNKSKEDRIELQNTIKLLQSDLENAHKSEIVQSNSLGSSRKLITEQQAIIAQLVNVKYEVKTCRVELDSKDKTIQELRREISNIEELFQNEKQKLFNDYQVSIEDFKSGKDYEVRKLKAEMESHKYSSEHNISELNNKIVKLQLEKEEQINAITLDYEEQFQKAHAQLLQMRDEIQSLREMNNQNVCFYKKKINTLENKLSMETNKPAPVQYGNYQRKSNQNSNFEMNSKKQSSEYKAFHSNNLNPMYENNQDTRDSTSFEISECSPPRNEKNLVEMQATEKPSKRKLFNKNTEYFEV